MGRRPPAEPFHARVERSLRDTFLRVAVPAATRRFHLTRRHALAELGEPLRWRQLARAIRAHTIANLDRYLAQAADAVEARGGRVHWALDAAAAVEAVLSIARAAGVRRVVKSKSMVTEELELNRWLEAEGIEVVETDLGEYIIQLDGDSPSHIIAPAVHKTREQVRQLFSRLAGQELPDDAQALTDFARRRLREKFLSADMGISGANFVVAETGHVVLVTNEGNGRMVTSLPRVHVAVMGMERVVPTWEDLAVLLEVLPRSATGQKLSVYTSITGGGPAPAGEGDGPQEFHLVIVDNGRSRLLGTRYQEGLHCIRCGACLNACPVYREIGGHAYGGVYSGPIGAVITPLLEGFDGWEELPHASSLCGACHEACPVLIPLHDLLVDLRSDEADQERAGRWDVLAFRAYRWLCERPWAYRWAARAAAALQRPLEEAGWLRGGPGPLKAWTEGRDFPAVAARTFRDRWRDLAAGEGDGQ
ncbi:MAG: LutB/LldF family L-lactate oxidation iron-sulfur protein [Thermaerobacter sp.]